MTDMHRRDFMKASLAGMALVALPVSTAAALAPAQTGLRIVAYGPHGILEQWAIPEDQVAWHFSGGQGSLDFIDDAPEFEFVADCACVLTDVRIHGFTDSWNSGGIFGEKSEHGISVMPQAYRLNGGIHLAEAHTVSISCGPTLVSFD